jgi:PilZ domain
MLEQTIALRSAGSHKAAKAERRAGARALCDASILFQPLTTQKSPGWRPARIRNISVRNIGLAMDHGVPCGTILSVKLEGAHRRFRRPLIVRVTRATERPGEGWHVGCTFVLPLSDDELQALLTSAQRLVDEKKQESTGKGIEPSSHEHDPFLHRSAKERRSSPRRRVTIPVLLCYDSIHAETFQGLAIDSSKIGLGLLAVRPFARGTVLQVRPVHSSGKPASVRVKVMCCRAQQKRWMIGVRFLFPPTADVLFTFG